MRRVVVWGALMAPLWAAALPVAAAAAPLLESCRVPGLAQDAQCGSVRRPLDPDAPNGTQIDVRFAVLPALARNKKPDPVFFLAGGPGQSAMALAAQLSQQFSRVLYRRDLVLIDQRGTGRSAPLRCEDDARMHPLSEADPQVQLVQMRQCMDRLRQLPHGDLRHYTTRLAMEDANAVREALGAQKVNLIGGSYGTRAALEFLRQFPQHVRRVVIDGVAPPDMVLPLSFSPDAQAAFDAVLAACEADPACVRTHGPVREPWQRVLARLPHPVTVLHPMTGRPETFVMTRDMLTAMVRAPLYAPGLAAALPHAIAEAAQGRFTAIIGLSSSLGASRNGASRVAMGMHLSVICAEDVPRMALPTAERPGPDFGDGFSRFYQRACADWPRGAVPDAFYAMSTSPAPALVLSGGADPVTPPRHGERVAQALGPLARHVVVAQAGHGVMSLPCMRDVIYRFIDAVDDAQARAVDAGCAANVPRPPAFRPVAAGPGADAQGAGK